MATGRISHNLAELATLVGAELIGDPLLLLSRVAAPPDAGPDALVFVESTRALEAARGSHAGAILSRPDLGLPVGRDGMLHANPRWAFARIAAALRPPSRERGIHEQALVEDGVELGAGSWIGPGCVIGAGVRIGANCRLHARVILEPGVELGQRVEIQAGAVLGGSGFGYVPGPGGLLRSPQLGGLFVGDDVEIGANSTIDGGALQPTRIGAGTKIDNLVQIGHGVIIGRDVRICAQVGISGSAILGDRVVLGGQVGISEHVVIGDDVVLGGRSTLFRGKKLLRAGVYAGHPARPVRDARRALAIVQRLPGLLDRLRALEERSD